MDTYSFIFHLKTKIIYKDIAEVNETRFDSSNFELDRSFPKGINKIVIRLMKYELGRQIIKEFGGLRTTYSFLKGNDEDKKAKCTKTW